ncbi:hypothetical protein [Pseudolysinimonas sp.]
MTEISTATLREDQDREALQTEIEDLRRRLAAAEAATAEWRTSSRLWERRSKANLARLGEMQSAAEVLTRIENKLDRITERNPS